jgi:hypothetical protein
MTWNGAASSPRTRGAPPRPARRRRAFAVLLLGLGLSGCETMDRMDFFDRFFEAAPQTGSVAATDSPPNPAAAPWRTDQDLQPAPVVAMEPIPNPPLVPYGRERDAAAAQPAAVRATEPRPDPAAPPVASADAEQRTRLLVRQNPWLTQFWMELTPAQQARVRRQIRRGEVVLASGGSEPAAVWDPMGLSDRARLIFGSGDPPPAERPAPPPPPPAKRDHPILARDS